MSTVRELLAEADALRAIARRAATISNGMGVERNRAHDIGGVKLYSNRGFPNDLVIIGALRDALGVLVADHVARADEIESRIEVTR